jgi:hypothetical protein
MTPGLGNIFDAARFGTPTIWLPPANDSQGRQLHMLAEREMVDGHLDWHTFISPQARIDYNAPQQEVLKQVAAHVDACAGNTRRRDSLKRTMTPMFDSLKTKLIGNATALMFELGSGGADKVASLVVEQARKGRSNA